MGYRRKVVLSPVRAHDCQRLESEVDQQQNFRRGPALPLARCVPNVSRPVRDWDMCNYDNKTSKRLAFQVIK